MLKSLCLGVDGRRASKSQYIAFQGGHFRTLTVWMGSCGLEILLGPLT